ncbi:glutathione S-transferase family protein [Algiphilus sp.]|uniref:glutathione S-transferase family protein n=1 Tax=Algiphilus sp. TaxID=1872431 RepID=UPI003B52B20D
MRNTIRIHRHPLSGHSHRVQLFASLAGIQHELKDVDLANGEHKQPAFLALNPFGQVPVIEDGETVLADANAILVYLARKYAPDYLPTDPVEEAQVQRWLSVAANEIANGPAAARLVTVFGATLDAELAQSKARNVLKTMDSILQDRQWLVADRPTIADVAIYSYVAHAPEGNVSLAPYANVRALLKRIESLPGFVPMVATKVGLAA